MSASSNNDSDWLLSSDDETARVAASRAGSKVHPAAARQASARRVPTMGERDWRRIASKFEDEGYREGITAGKQATLQAGFDQGFNATGSTLGRSVGNLRGEATALLAFLTSTVSVPSQAPSVLRGARRSGAAAAAEAAAASVRKRAQTSSGAAGAAAAQKEREAEQRNSKAKALIPVVRSLVSDLNRLRLADIAPPDYEALVHEAEHRAEDADGGQVVTVQRESEGSRRNREAVVPTMQERMREVTERARGILGG